MKLVLDNGKEIVLSQELAGRLEEVVKKEEVKKTGWERVSFEKDYFIITTTGEVDIIHDEDDTLDISYYRDASNYFSDKELAEKVAFRQTLERRLMRFSAEHDGDKIDWNNSTAKFYIKYNHETCSVYVASSYDCETTGVIYFHAIETAKLAIDTFKDDLIKYFTTMSL